MKKLLFSVSVLLLVTIAANAQSPAFFNYQGVARNSVGNALVNKTIKLRLSIHDGSALGPIVFSETRTVITNAFGLFSVQVGGAGATNVVGTIAGTNWNVGSKWMQVEIDPDGGNTLKDIGTTQLTSVPYSLYTSQSGDVVLPFNKTQNEDVPLFKLINSGNNASSLAFEGLSSTTANNAAAVRGIITSVAPGVFSAGVVGQNNGTGSNGVGIYGTQNGTGYGVYGTTPGGVGVFGNSTSGTGVHGQSVSGPSVMGYQSNNGTSNAGYFQNLSTINNATVLRVQTNGPGEGFGVNMTGLGKGGSFTINNAANSSTVLEASTNGLGKVALLQNTNAVNSSTILDVSSNGISRTAQFLNTNAANTVPNTSFLSNGAGDNIQSLMTGTGKAGLFNINNPANANFVMDASSNGTNNVINSLNTGLGRAGFFQVNNTASTADALSAVTNGVGASWAIRGTSTGTNGAGLFIQSNAANTANNLQSNQAGLGRAGLFNATNASNAANALEVNMAGTGFAASFSSTNATPKALRTQGAVQFSGVNEAPGRVMATVDGSGTATWQNAASVGLVSGSGTMNYVPKWTPDGTFIGNSQIFDNGTNMSISGAVDAAYKMTINGKFKVTASVTDTAVAIFENTSSGGNSDGIVIKMGRTHPRWNGSAYANVTNPVTQGVETQVNQIRDWIYGNDSFSWDDLINLMPSQYLTGTICNLTNLISTKINEGIGLPVNISGTINNALGLPVSISGPINSALGLPFSISGPLNNAMGLPYTIAGATVIPAIPSFGMPALPSFSIPAIPSFSIPAIPQLNCSSLPTLAFPVFVFNDVTNSLTKENEFISFVDKDNRKLGAIRAQSIQNFSYDYFDGQKLLDLASEFIGIDIIDDFMSIVSGISQMVTDYNAIGVEYSSGNGDYAEWLERANPGEEISFGDIVAVKGGKITKELAGAEQIMAVSKNPIVLGNMPEAAKIKGGNNIAFMGQIPVKVVGAVHSGDYIIAKGEVPGYGIAVHPKDMTVADFKLAVGRSWDTNLKDGPKMVNTVVGVHNHDFLNIIGSLQQKAEKTDERLKAIETLLQPGIGTKEPKTKKGF